MTSQESCCKIVDFQEYLGKKELELQMKQIVNREIMVIVPTQLSQIVSVGKKLLLGETVTMIKIVACALIMTGVVTLSLAKQKKPPEEVVTVPEG